MMHFAIRKLMRCMMADLASFVKKNDRLFESHSRRGLPKAVQVSRQRLRQSQMTDGKQQLVTNEHRTV